jgi:branched-chain amino acid transport system substrate-binding protein
MKMPRILLVLGDQDRIRKKVEANEIKRKFQNRAEFTTLEEPPIDEFLRTIRDPNQFFDIIIIIGHSDTNCNGIDGEIGINVSEKISIAQFSAPFQTSVQNKLKLVILAGCCTIGTARSLGANPINVPNVIGFRLPIHQNILRRFFESLCQYWINESRSLEVAVSKTREDLMTCNQSNYPGSAILPVLFSSPYKPAYLYPTEPNSTFTPPEFWDRIRIQVQAIMPDKVWKYIIIGLIVTLLILLTTWLTSLFTHKPIPIDPITEIPSSPSPATLAIQSSIGDRVLFSKALFPSESEAKTEGVNAFNSKDKKHYDTAVNKFNEAHEKNKQDPELVIYSNNANVLKDESKFGKSITIPITSSATSGFSTHVEVLRGAALAQMEINKQGGISINGEQQKVLLKIYLDDNDLAKAKEVVSEIIKKKYKQLVGHVDSEISQQVASTYNDNSIVMMTATSSTVSLGDKDNQYTYIFRTMPDAKIMAQYLAGYIKKVNKSNIGICRHTPEAGRKFNILVSNYLTKTEKISISKTPCIMSDDFSAEEIIKKMINEDKIDGLIIYTHLNEPNDLKAVKEIIQAVKKHGNGKVSLFGSHSLISTDIINLGKTRGFENLNGMMFITPKHPDYNATSKEFRNRFYSQFKIEPTWRDMMAYDAVKAIAYGLNKSDGTNEKLQIKLHISSKEKKPIADGSSAPIDFSDSGNRYLVPLITHLKCAENTCKFELTKYQPTIITK